METHTLTKISAITGIIVSGIVVGVLVFAVSMMLMSGGGPFGSNVEIKPDSAEEKEIISQLEQLNSIKTFKEINPKFREKFFNNGGHQLQYYIQARNDNTGNVYSLNIQYQTYNKQFFESTSCQLIDTGINNSRIDDPFRRHGENRDLFLDSTIIDSNCLDDDFYDKYPHLISDESR